MSGPALMLIGALMPWHIYGEQHLGLAYGAGQKIAAISMGLLLLLQWRPVGWLTSLGLASGGLAVVAYFLWEHGPVIFRTVGRLPHLGFWFAVVGAIWTVLVGLARVPLVQNRWEAWEGRPSKEQWLRIGRTIGGLIAPGMLLAVALLPYRIEHFSNASHPGFTEQGGIVALVAAAVLLSVFFMRGHLIPAWTFGIGSTLAIYTQQAILISNAAVGWGVGATVLYRMVVPWMLLYGGALILGDAIRGRQGVRVADFVGPALLLPVPFLPYASIGGGNQSTLATTLAIPAAVWLLRIALIRPGGVAAWSLLVGAGFLIYYFLGATNESVRPFWDLAPRLLYFTAAPWLLLYGASSTLRIRDTRHRTRPI